MRNDTFTGLQDLASPPSGDTPATDLSLLDDAPGGLIKIPWTISNRYYSADVHFAVRTMHGMSPHEVQNVPAVIFVWAQGEVRASHPLHPILHDVYTPR